MEIIDNRNDREREMSGIVKGRNIYLGFIFILAGMNWLLYNLDIISFSTFTTIFSWNMLLVVIGGYLIVIKRYVAGGILGAIGAAYTICELFNVDLRFGEIILPAALIAVGIAIIFNKK